MALNAADIYRQQAIQTNNPSKILLMVFDGAISALKRAKVLLDENNIPETHNQILKAQDLVGELIVALDFQYEISHYLAGLYQYIIDRLVDANVKKDHSIIDEVLELLNEMRDMWQETSKLAAAQAAPANQNNTPAEGTAVPQGSISVRG